MISGITAVAETQMCNFFTLYFLGLIEIPFISKWTPVTPCQCKNIFLLIGCSTVGETKKPQPGSNILGEKKVLSCCVTVQRGKHMKTQSRSRQAEQKIPLPLRSLLNCFSFLSSQSADVNLLIKWLLSLLFLNTIKSVSHIRSLCDCRSGIILCGNT